MTTKLCPAFGGTDHWGNVGVSWPTDDLRVSTILLSEDTPFRCCAKCFRRYTQLDAFNQENGWGKLMERVGGADIELKVTRELLTQAEDPEVMARIFLQEFEAAMEEFIVAAHRGEPVRELRMRFLVADGLESRP